jgi:hypothetical protein
MPAISAYAEPLMLGYLLKGATATVPAAWGVGLSLGSPTAASGSEIASGTGIVRQGATFSSAASNTFTNANAMTFGAVNAAATITGIDVFDTLPASYTANAGNLLVFGTLATVRTLGSGDSLVLPAGSMSVTLT